MDDPLRFGALDSISVDVAHYIMPHLFFPCFCYFIINIVFMCFQLGDLLIRDVQSQLFFRFRQRNPQTAPGFKLKICGKQVLHLFTGITSAEGAFIVRPHSSLIPPLIAAGMSAFFFQVKTVSAKRAGQASLSLF